MSRRLVDPGTVGALTDVAPPAIVDSTHRLGVDEAASAAHRLAAELRDEYGIGHGDRILVRLPNWWEMIVVYHACWRLGAVPVPLHHRTGPAAVDDFAKRTSPALRIEADGVPRPSTLLVRGRGGDFARLRANPGATSEPAPDGADPCILIPTSGSSGRAKLVRHRHHALRFKAEVMAHVHQLTSNDTVLMPAPLTHVSGLLYGVLVPGFIGGTTVLMDRWDPEQALRLIAAEKVTLMVGPPTFFLDMASSPAFRREDVASLRILSVGGAGVTHELVARLTETFGAFVKRVYGSTEAPSVATTHAGDPPARAFDTDGRPTDHVELRVVEPATGREVAPGHVGELHVRGYELFDGYADEEDSVEQLDAEGWFHTGDLATVDEAGWLRIQGRVKRMIIRGGENISPLEVERVCERIPGVTHALALGMPDERLGERVGIILECDQSIGMDEIRAACKAVGLPPFAWPERILTFPRLPRLPSGKADVGRLQTALTDGDHR